MYSGKQLLFAVALITGVYARTLPPKNCEQDVIQHCLKNFEVKYASCDADDFVCQCDHVVTTGAMCYSPCPQGDMTDFIKSYAEGKCAQYDPVLKTLKPVAGSSLGLKSHQLDKGTVPEAAPPSIDAKQDSHPKAMKPAKSATNHSMPARSKSKPKPAHSNSTIITVLSPAKDGKLAKLINAIHHPHLHERNKREETSLSIERNHTGVLATSHTAEEAMTLTADPPVTATKTISVDEYRSQLEKKRYKERLASIRRERRRSSELAAERTASAAANGGSSSATTTNVQDAEHQQRLDEENRVIGEKVAESRSRSEADHGKIRKAKDNSAVSLQTSPKAITAALAVALFFTISLI